uniref:Tetraspanin n=1 Tax=Cyprinus carpio TaxID=7962 RepID=B7TQ39_CYPCA|nr:CD9 antigen [Cyprinus carpio]
MMSKSASGEQCIKYMIFVFNFIFWLAGTGVLAVGLWLRFDERTKEFFTGEDASTVFLTGVYILIVAGAIMMVVGFLGCCGAIRESTCMLGLFFVFLLIIFAAEVAAGIWGLSNQENIVTDVQRFYTEVFNKYKETKQEALRESLRAIQYGLRCCGPSGTFFDGAAETCPKAEGLQVLVTKSCPDAIKELFTFRLQVIGGVGIGVGVVMIFGMIFSMLLCCAIRRTRDIV